MLEEFHGHLFPSWGQVRPSGDTSGATDTAALQAMCSNISRPGFPSAYYVNPGRYYQNATLGMGTGYGDAAYRPVGQGLIGPMIVGHSRDDTVIQWVGPPPNSSGATNDAIMLVHNGVTQLRLARLTFDGAGIANVGVMDAYHSIDGAPTPDNQYFPTGNRYEDLGFVNLLGVSNQSGPQSETAGLMLGVYGFGASETSIMRCYFNYAQNPYGSKNPITGNTNPDVVGIMTYNFNSLDNWIWDCQFIGPNHGVCNTTYQAGFSGDFVVARSAFQCSEHDIFFGNLGANMSSRWNYSAPGAWRHVEAQAIGNFIASFTVQGCNIGGKAAEIIQLSNAGPIIMVDNLVGAHGTGGAVAIIAECPYSGDNSSGEQVGINNTYADGSPYFASAFTRTHSISDTFSIAWSDPGFPARPAEPPVVTRTIWDNQSSGGSIQSAINSAQPFDVIHIGAGQIGVSQTIQVPANFPLFFEGDSQYATNLVWSGSGTGPVFMLNLPSQVIFRNMQVQGASIADCFGTSGPNGGGGVIHIDGFANSQAAQVGGILANNLGGIRVDVINSSVSLNEQDGWPGTTGVYGISSENGSTVHVIFGTTGNGNGPFYRCYSGGTIACANIYAENSSRTSNLIAGGGNGTFSLDGGRIVGGAVNVDFSSFSGPSTISNYWLGESCPNVSIKVGNNQLLLGASFGSQAFPGPNPPYVIGGATQYAILNPRQQVDNSGQTTQIAEVSAGVSDQNAYVTSHLAPLRGIKPIDMQANPPANYTQIQFINVTTYNERLSFNLQATGGVVNPALSGNATGQGKASATLSVTGSAVRPRKAIQLMGQWQQSVAASIEFAMVSSSDHISALTGASPTLQISKAGGSFAAPAGTVSEVGGGWYIFHATAVDTNTLGDLAINVTATGGDPTALKEQIVAFNPNATTLGGISPGPYTVNWRGVYSLTNTYAPGDSVDFFGKQYICHTAAAAGVLPTDMSKFVPQDLVGEVVSMTIAPVSWPYPGKTGQLQIQGLFSDDTIRLGLNAYAVWSTSDATKVTVDQLGNYSCLAIGAATITAKLQGVSTTLVITVAHPMFGDGFAGEAVTFPLWGNHFTIDTGSTQTILTGTTPSADNVYAEMSVPPLGGAQAAIDTPGLAPISKIFRFSTVFRLSAWNVTGGACQIIQLVDGSGHGTEIYDFNGAWTIGVSAADGTFLQASLTFQSFAVGTWYQIDLLQDNSGAKSVYRVYVAGVLDTTLNDTTTGTPWQVTGGRLGPAMNPSQPGAGTCTVDYDWAEAYDN
jgi:hypothetical protein